MRDDHSKMTGNPTSDLVSGQVCPATARYRTQTKAGQDVGKEFDCLIGRTMPPTPGRGQRFIRDL